MKLETNGSASDFKYWLTQSLLKVKEITTGKACKSKQSLWQIRSEEQSNIIPRFQELGEGCQTVQRSELHGKNPHELSCKSQKSDSYFQQRNEGQGRVLNQATVSCHYLRNLSLSWQCLCFALLSICRMQESRRPYVILIWLLQLSIWCLFLITFISFLCLLRPKFHRFCWNLSFKIRISIWVWPMTHIFCHNLWVFKFPARQIA